MNSEIESFMSFLKMTLIALAGCVVLAAIYFIAKCAVYLAFIVDKNLSLN